MYREKAKAQYCKVLALIIIIFFSVPFAFGSKKGMDRRDKKELKFWHSIGTYNKDILNSFIDTFNESNRQISVKGVFQGNEEDVYLKLFSQENLPDIVQIPVQFLPSLKKKNYIIDMTSLIPLKIKDDIPEKIWNSVLIQDKIYGMPFSYSADILFVNQHILRISGIKQEKIPESWENIVSIAEKIRHNTRDKWGIFIPMESTAQFISFIQSYTGKPVLQNGKITINTAEVKEAMTFLRQLVYLNEIMPSKITAYEAEGLFLSGNLGIMLAQSSMLVYTESQLAYDLNVWHLPSGKSIAPIITGTCLAILKSDIKREREAFKFIEYLVDYENAIKWHTHTGTPAIRTSAKESLDLLIFYEESPNHMTSAIELEKGEIFNPSSGFLNGSSIIKKAIEEIMINGKDPDKILDAAQIEIDKLTIGL
ncbi:MAG: extracellular solute-binding protein [Spirochaetes bacterium]|nr:extracellular solute-binding protein [Spirochaetota bacterium]